jgi:hypothetical protein
VQIPIFTRLLRGGGKKRWQEEDVTQEDEKTGRFDAGSGEVRRCQSTSTSPFSGTDCGRLTNRHKKNPFFLPAFL